MRQRSTTTGDYYITHSMHVRSRWRTAYRTPLQQLRVWIHLMTVSMLNTALFQYFKRQDQRISKTCKSTFIFCSSWNLWGGPFFAFSLPGGRRTPLLPVSYAAAHSRKVPPPKPRVKAKSSLSGRNYFITMHHQAGVNFENVTEVKFRDVLLTGTVW